MMKTAVLPQPFRIGMLLGIALTLTGCAGLLPDSRQETKTPWQSYADAEKMYANVTPGKTTLSELKALGVDPEQTSNVELLGQADMLRRLLSFSTDLRMLHPSLQECVSPTQSCFAYEIEQTHLDRKRFGNFWLDFLNFKRRTNVSGWQFDAIFVIKNDTVVYKHWSGKPSIHKLEEESNPLGPLQGIGPSLIGR